MQLDEFIQETLVQLVKGASAANEELISVGAVVFPKYYTVKHDGHYVYNDDKHEPSVSRIEFDVAVTTSEEKGRSGGVGVAIASIGLGAKRTEEDSTSTVSRVRFEIPVLYPQNKVEPNHR